MADFFKILAIGLRRFCIGLKPAAIVIICINSFTVLDGLNDINQTNEKIVIELKQLNTISTHRLRNQPND